MCKGDPDGAEVLQSCAVFKPVNVSSYDELAEGFDKSEDRTSPDTVMAIPACLDRPKRGQLDSNSKRRLTSTSGYQRQDNRDHPTPTPVTAACKKPKLQNHV